MFGKPRILSLFPNEFDKFDKTRALMLGPLYLQQEEHSCKVLYICNKRSTSVRPSISATRGAHMYNPLYPNTSH